MITADVFVNTCMIPYHEGAGYIWGSWGQIHTKEAQKNATREQTKKWGSRWIGKRCWDCSGLIYWACNLYGEKSNHGSNTLYHEYCSAKGKLVDGKRADGKELKTGSVVFLYDRAANNRHHIGVYIGDGRVVEAKGTYYGVVLSDTNHWDEWGELKCVDLSGKVVLDMKSLRMGCRDMGDEHDVKDLQHNLNLLMYNAGNEDGIFGKKTKEAVELFQKAHGLTVDGIVGEKTQAAIQDALKPSQTPTPAPMIPDYDVISEQIDRIESSLDILRKLIGKKD